MSGRVHIGIVLNPQARRAGAAALPDRLHAICRAHGHPVTLLCTRSPLELPAALGELRRQAVGILAVCGGDGTLMATVSAALADGLPALPPLLILPGGTMNTIARNVGLRERPEALLTRLLHRLAAPPGLAALPRFRQELLSLLIHDEQPLRAGQPDRSVAPQSRRRYGCIFSAAMGARYLAAYASRARPSLGWAAWLGLRTIGSSLIPGGGRLARELFARTPATLTVDGEAVADSAFRLLICATVPDVGLGMRVPWRAGCVPGRFQVIASSLDLVQNVRQLGRIHRGQPMHGPHHLDRLAQRAELRFATAQPLTLDGDLFSATQLTLSLGPPLELLLP